MKKLLLIKLGGSLITDKSQDYTARPTIITRLAKEIKSARKNFDGDIIIAHGSGSFAHTPAAKFGTQDGLVNQKSFVGLPIVADAAIQINRIVMHNFLEEGLPAVSFSPASMILAKARKTKFVNLFPLLHALNLDFLPILYGDIIFDEQQGFCIYSAERTLSLLAEKLASKYSQISLLFCGDSDGVYDDKNQTIQKITPQSFEKFKQFITGSAKTDVTGGMLHKVQASLDLAQKGFSTLIINGHKSGELKRSILGQSHTGTLITNDK